MAYARLHELLDHIHSQLLPNLYLESVASYDPVVVHAVPTPWEIIGAGNYAAVFCHPDHPHCVIKIYAPGRPGWADEVEVYRRLGSHPAFSECYYAEEGVLVLKRLNGVTLYDCLHQGLVIPEQVILDIDAALAIARKRGLTPHDVHGRNVMMSEGRGLVVDISDFLKPEDAIWEDVKWAYYWLYRPLLARLPFHVPYKLLNGIRSLYRLYRKLRRWWRQKRRLISRPSNKG